MLSIQDPDQGFDNGQVDADDLRTGFVQAGNEPVRGAKPEAKTVPKAAAKPSAEPTAPQSKAKAEPPKPSGGLFGGFFSGNKK